MYTLYYILKTIYYIVYIYNKYTIYILNTIYYIYGVAVDITGRVYVKMYLLTRVDCMEKPDRGKAIKLLHQILDTIA